MLSIAPMMDWTDRHYRYFFRLISKHATLYTEMVTANALIKGHAYHLLDYHVSEHPLVLQLGGSDPLLLRESALLGEARGYDAINLNVGCPSPRVQSGSFGACLMQDAKLVASCIQSMQDAVKIPVTVKCRTGIGKTLSYDFLKNFVQTISDVGCKTFIIHARNAWLEGLNPKENRTIPPLQYDFVYQLKEDFPLLHTGINGGIKSLDAIDAHLKKVDEVMIGREAYHNPYAFSTVDTHYYNETTTPLSREAVLLAMADYLEREQEKGTKPWAILRHIQGLYYNEPNARIFRTKISATTQLSHLSKETFLATFLT
jgi:tRNA-dihydrouridine synthase A